MPNLRDEFLLDPDVTYLNHGSFGATPRAVFQVYQAWQLRLERQPVRFFDKELTPVLKQARDALGSYLHTDGDDLVYIPNTTFGVNIVARSLKLQPGDEILASDHEYGACNNAWHYVAERRSVTYNNQPISLPVTTSEEIVEQLWAGVNDRTRVIYLSHITSPTALTMPVAAICRRARAAGILTVIDGAHAPGQIDVDLSIIDPDFYFGNCHKWLMSPKGAAFLYTRPDKQHLIEPLVVGWGWGPERSMNFGSDFLNNTQFLGTNDLSAYLSVPAAIDFQRRHDWPAQRRRCHALAAQAHDRIIDLTGLPSIYPANPGFYQQMVSIPLPPVDDPKAFRRNLYNRFRIEVPFPQWRGQRFARVSIQAYNEQADVDALVESLIG